MTTSPAAGPYITRPGNIFIKKNVPKETTNSTSRREWQPPVQQIQARAPDHNPTHFLLPASEKESVFEITQKYLLPYSFTHTVSPALSPFEAGEMGAGSARRRKITAE